jgi:hypothetical protein
MNIPENSFDQVAEEALAQAAHLCQQHVLKQHLGDLRERWRIEDAKPQLANLSCLPTDRAASAIHESAHVVIWLAQGGALGANDYVTILGEPVFRQQLGWVSRDDAKLQAARFITAGFSGYAAERRVDPSAERSPDDNVIAIQTYMRFILDPSPVEYLESKEREAAQLVAKLWPVITQFADVLLERGTITGADCETLFRQIISGQPDYTKPSA